MDFPHPPLLLPLRLHDQVLWQGLAPWNVWLRRFPAMPRAPQCPCRAISEQIALRNRSFSLGHCFQQVAKLLAVQRSFLCDCFLQCAATVKEFVDTPPRLMADTVGSNRAAKPIFLTSHPSQALLSLRRSQFLGKRLKMYNAPRPCCYVHRAMQNAKWLLEAVRGRQMMIIPGFALWHE